MNNIRKLKYIIFSLTILLIASTVISIDKFDTANFIRSGTGFIRIIITGTETVKIKDNPEIYLAEPENGRHTLINFMEKHGYEFLGFEQKLLVFGNGVNKKYVYFTLNAYYSKWVFKE